MKPATAVVEGDAMTMRCMASTQPTHHTHTLPEAAAPLCRVIAGNGNVCLCYRVHAGGWACEEGWMDGRKLGWPHGNWAFTVIFPHYDTYCKHHVRK